jgi:hypothetical protein
MSQLPQARAAEYRAFVVTLEFNAIKLRYDSSSFAAKEFPAP